MDTTGEPEIWTASRVTARLGELRGKAPEPVCHVIFRATTLADGRTGSFYDVPGDKGRRDEAAFGQWLAERGLAGEERLSVSVLVIRETLDARGLVTEGVLERRRGGADGPFYGQAARVEFSGAARRVRQYRAESDGRLTRLPAGAEAAAPEDGPGHFAGDDAAVHAFLGPGALVLDRRPPSLSEDTLGLAVIIHARDSAGVETGCGIGWHGGMAFVLAADFPRNKSELVPPPELNAAMAAHDLIPLETRRDGRGLRMIARRRHDRGLVAVSGDRHSIQIDPWQPMLDGPWTADQRRWMSYAQTYEARTLLDCWGMDDTGGMAAVSIGADGEAWLHSVDAEGIETGCRPGNETAAAALHREGAAVPSESPEPPAPADSLLTKVRAYLRVMALLRAATDACASPAGTSVPAAALDPLRALPVELSVLNAAFSSGSVLRLLRMAESGTMTVHNFAVALEDLVARLRDELALTRIVLLPPAAHRPEHEAPFGTAVETRFPQAAYDIEEAVHCLALRRTTAAVLHAMKVMRHALPAVEQLLGTGPLAHLSWARQIAAVRQAPLVRPGFDHPLIDALGRVRRAWLGSGLMPADKYTEQEAEAVLEAVAAFMRTLAACLDAGGAP